MFMDSLTRHGSPCLVKLANQDGINLVFHLYKIQAPSLMSEKVFNIIIIIRSYLAFNRAVPASLTAQVLFERAASRSFHWDDFSSGGT